MSNAHNNAPLNKNALIRPYVEAIEAFLTANEIDPLKTRTTDDDIVTYSFVTPTGMSVHYSVYTDSYNTVFLFFEACLGVFPKEAPTELSTAMLRDNGLHFFPMWLCMANHAGHEIASLQFRTYANGVTLEHVRLRLETILELGFELQKKYSDAFGLAPLPSSKSRF